MSKNSYEWDKNYNACRLQFDYGSLVKFSTFIGFCFGIVSVPIYLFITIGETASLDVGLLIFETVIFTPIVGLANGALMGVFAYPLYSYLGKKNRGYIYKGIFVGLLNTDK